MVGSRPGGSTATPTTSEVLAACADTRLAARRRAAASGRFNMDDPRENEPTGLSAGADYPQCGGEGNPPACARRLLQARHEAARRQGRSDEPAPARNRGEELLRIRMLRRREKIGGALHLDDAALAHHGDAVAQL